MVLGAEVYTSVLPVVKSEASSLGLPSMSTPRDQFLAEHCAAPTVVDNAIPTKLTPNKSPEAILNSQAEEVARALVDCLTDPSAARFTAQVKNVDRTIHNLTNECAVKFAESLLDQAERSWSTLKGQLMQELGVTTLTSVAQRDLSENSVSMSMTALKDRIATVFLENSDWFRSRMDIHSAVRAGLLLAEGTPNDPERYMERLNKIESYFSDGDPKFLRADEVRQLELARRLTIDPEIQGFIQNPGVSDVPLDPVSRMSLAKKVSGHFCAVYEMPPPTVTPLPPDEIENCHDRENVQIGDASYYHYAVRINASTPLPTSTPEWLCVVTNVLHETRHIYQGLTCDASPLVGETPLHDHARGRTEPRDYPDQVGAFILSTACYTPDGAGYFRSFKELDATNFADKVTALFLSTP